MKITVISKDEKQAQHLQEIGGSVVK